MTNGDSSTKRLIFEITGIVFLFILTIVCLWCYEIFDTQTGSNSSGEFVISTFFIGMIIFGIGDLVAFIFFVKKHFFPTKEN
jgi:RsiW-degrading membrane proteinase PrsW (M82 family)